MMDIWSNPSWCFVYMFICSVCVCVSFAHKKEQGIHQNQKKKSRHDWWLSWMRKIWLFCMIDIKFSLFVFKFLMLLPLPLQTQRFCYFSSTNKQKKIIPSSKMWAVSTLLYFCSSYHCCCYCHVSFFFFGVYITSTSSERG